MLQRTEGIVLRTNTFGEADLIVTYLTSDHGIIRTFAKSPRKIKSRFGSSLEPLTCSKIAFWGKEDSALPRLTQSDIICSFDSVRSKFDSFLLASQIAELMLLLLPERDVSRNAYALMMALLKSLEGAGAEPLLLLFYKVRLLKIAGYLPRVDGCGRCGAAGTAFFLSQGTVLCRRCSGGTGSAFLLSSGTVSLLTNLAQWTSSKIGRLRPSQQQLNELTRLIDDHVRRIAERDLRTAEFFGAAAHG